jgi:hypothetical protein
MSVITKLREPRIAGVAVFDVSMTALGGYLIAYKMGWNKPKTIVGFFLFGQATHMALGIKTKFNEPKE